MLTRDKLRWEKSDINKDNKITKEEYTAFLHPEEYDHMKDVVVDETLQDIDKDGDGSVSLDEYLGKVCSVPKLKCWWFRDLNHSILIECLTIGSLTPFPPVKFCEKDADLLSSRTL